MPRYFFGIIRVPMYEYNWGHTVAQIELIDIDQALTVYKRDENAGLKPGDKGYKPDAKKLDSAVQKWKQRKAEREKKGFKLDHFLRTGEKVPTSNENSNTTT